ncbi:MAG: hypothetical protein PUD72_05635 [Oscillospiraceae bacterium]|nr:hypothetical protein [Oscillospiraceae bacterium]
MRLDLNDQLQKGQALVNDDGRKKKRLLLGLAITYAVSLLLLIIFSVAFFVKTMDRFLDPNTSHGNNNTGSYTTSSEDDELANIAWGTKGESGDRNSSFGNYEEDSNFVYGTVSGTTYYSTFSGVRFSAPSDWNLSGYTEGSFSNILSPTDLKASSQDMSSNVAISYKSFKKFNYSKATDGLKNYIAQASEGQNSMINDSVSVTLGGNKFTGIIYKKIMDVNYSYYIEVLVAEVNGYVLEIYVESNTADELASVMAMFS